MVISLALKIRFCKRNITGSNIATIRMKASIEHMVWVAFLYLVSIVLLYEMQEDIHILSLQRLLSTFGIPILELTLSFCYARRVQAPLNLVYILGHCFSKHVL